MSPLPILVLLLAAPNSLDKGAKLLSDFRAEEAVALLEKAKGEGPYSYEDHARLYEQLGIGYAYLEQTDKALEAFDMLLAIDPARAISYTLSPKVTFLFEQARAKAAARPAPTVQVSWSRNLAVNEEVPIDVEVVADPMKFLDAAKLYWRQRGGPRYEAIETSLANGGRRTLTLPPVPAERSESIEIYLVAFDGQKNEVLEWGSEKRPREVALDYQPPAPWYGKWWVWTIAGVAVAAGAATAALVVTNEPGPTIDGSFQVGR